MSLLSDMLKENINIRMQSVCAATMYDVAGVHYLIKIIQQELSIFDLHLADWQYSKYAK